MQAVCKHRATVTSSVNLTSNYWGGWVCSSYPYGMIIPGLSTIAMPSEYNAYKFQSKEEIKELSLNWLDFHARMYDPVIGRTPTPDPHAENYYHLSPYSMFANNPLRYIDPDGRDIWEINELGEIINRIKDKTQDAFYFGSVDKDGNFNRRQTTDADGNKVDFGISFEYGTVTNQFDRTIPVKDANGNIVERNLTVFEIKGDDNATKLFEKMADTWYGTNVEWSHAKVGTENSGRNIIGTSHQQSSTAVGQYLLSTGYTLKEVNHNHPRGNANLSPGDASGAEKYHGKNPNTILNIYIDPGKYYRYNQRGMIK